MTQGCWATKRRCSFERIGFSSLRARALLSIFDRDSTLEESPVLVSLLCFAMAIARALSCVTSLRAIAPRGVDRLDWLLTARTESTLRSQIPNKCSMSLASERALLSASMKSSALEKLWPAPLGRLSNQGPRYSSGKRVRALRFLTPA